MNNIRKYRSKVNDMNLKSKSGMKLYVKTKQERFSSANQSGQNTRRDHDEKLKQTQLFGFQNNKTTMDQYIKTVNYRRKRMNNKS